MPSTAPAMSSFEKRRSDRLRAQNSKAPDLTVCTLDEYLAFLRAHRAFPPAGTSDREWEQVWTLEFYRNRDLAIRLRDRPCPSFAAPSTAVDITQQALEEKARYDRERGVK